jgi:hypothetical protein
MERAATNALTLCKVPAAILLMALPIYWESRYSKCILHVLDALLSQSLHTWAYVGMKASLYEDCSGDDATQVANYLL